MKVTSAPPPASAYSESLSDRAGEMRFNAAAHGTTRKLAGSTTYKFPEEAACRLPLLSRNGPVRAHGKGHEATTVVNAIVDARASHNPAVKLQAHSVQLDPKASPVAIHAEQAVVRVEVVTAHGSARRRKVRNVLHKRIH
mmetsp:Transcript_118800/g.380541  ORF Transcript_118800/g.380541 Transcript_118800/m.380541 type:complete len:140 (-) Transcript_118800:3384-3803(-)